jgi:hypothetical protein
MASRDDSPFPIKPRGDPSREDVVPDIQAQKPVRQDSGAQSQGEQRSSPEEHRDRGLKQGGLSNIGGAAPRNTGGDTGDSERRDEGKSQRE